MKVYRQF